MLRQMRMPREPWPHCEHLTTNMVFAHVEALRDGHVKLEAWRHGMWPVRPDWSYRITMWPKQHAAFYVDFRQIGFRLRAPGCIRVRLAKGYTVGGMFLTFDEKYEMMNCSLCRFDDHGGKEWQVCTLHGFAVQEFYDGLEAMLKHAVIPGGFHVL